MVNEVQVNLFLPDEEATFACATKLARVMGDTAVIFLYGQLGAGKTTFARGFLRALGYGGSVKSPTYTLVEPYESDTFTLYHFDFYRLRDAHELEFMGIRDYFRPHAICLIEWPENGAGILPEPDLSCYIEPRLQGREMRVEASSEQGKNILKRFQHEN